MAASRTVIYKELDYHAFGDVLGIVVRCFHRTMNKFASGPARLVSVRPRHAKASRGEIEVELAWVISDLTP